MQVINTEVRSSTKMMWHGIPDDYCVLKNMPFEYLRRKQSFENKKISSFLFKKQF